MLLRLVALNARYVHSCLALFYVRNELERFLPECAIDLLALTINDPYYQTLLRICQDRPLAVFFSVYVWNADYVWRLVHDLHRILPQTMIVLGGPEAEKGTDLFFLTKKNKSVPFSVVRGPIEGVPPAFYEDLRAGKLAPEYRAKTGSSFLLPYRAADWLGPLKDRTVYYESTRGCPFSCTYCLSSVGEPFVVKDLGEVQEELTRILAHAPKSVQFVDRTFNANPGRALVLWRFLADAGGDTRFHFEIAPDRFTDEIFAFLALMPAARFHFEIGVQSTNPLTLEAIRRPQVFSRVADNIRRLVELERVHVHVDLILGLPHETATTFRTSFNDIFDLGPHHIQMGLLKILPGTTMSEQAREYGMIASTTPPYAVLATRWLEHETLGHLYRVGECVEAFYNNRFFRSLWRYLQTKKEDAFGFFEGLLRICGQQFLFAQTPSQEQMAQMLLNYVADRPDRALVEELLRFDWLRSGHRFCPDCLGGSAVIAVREGLRRHMPPTLPGYYTYEDREEFFKRSLFARFSKEALAQLGFATKEGEATLCFLPELDNGVQKHQKVILLPGRC